MEREHYSLYWLVELIPSVWILKDASDLSESSPVQENPDRPEMQVDPWTLQQIGCVTLIPEGVQLGLNSKQKNGEGYNVFYCPVKLE